MALFLPVFIFTIVVFAVVALAIYWVERSAARRDSMRERP